MMHTSPAFSYQRLSRLAAATILLLSAVASSPAVALAHEWVTG
jgi:hypothetical protein